MKKIIYIILLYFGIINITFGCITRIQAPDDNYYYYNFLIIIIGFITFIFLGYKYYKKYKNPYNKTSKLQYIRSYILLIILGILLIEILLSINNHYNTNSLINCSPGIM